MDENPHSCCLVGLLLLCRLIDFHNCGMDGCGSGVEPASCYGKVAGMSEQLSEERL